MKPLIGITSERKDQYSKKINLIKYAYVQAVVEAGGIPIVIPVLEDIRDLKRYIDIIDGIIFSGGEDISPIHFHQEPIKEVTEMDRDRDESELELFRHAYEKKMPIFGICRGVQLINVALGGSLYQDIYREVEDVIGHTCTYNVQEGYHTIEIDRDSMLYKIYEKDDLLVNSLHHQGLKKLGKNLRSTSRTIDGMIESVETNEDRTLFGVQFHPELMAIKYKDFLKPFEYLVKESS